LNHVGARRVQPAKFWRAKDALATYNVTSELWNTGETEFDSETRLEILKRMKTSSPEAFGPTP